MDDAKGGMQLMIMGWSEGSHDKKGTLWAPKLILLVIPALSDGFYMTSDIPVWRHC